MAPNSACRFTLYPGLGASGVIGLIKSGKADIGFLAYD